MQTFEPLILTEGQKAILSAFGNQCDPKMFVKKVPADIARDLEFLKQTGLIDRAQNHISDRGAAYLITQCGVTFDRFIKAHHNWQQRLATRIFVGKALAKSKEAENYYHLKRYELLIKFNVFKKDNSEADPKNMGEIMTDLFGGLIESPLFNWQDLKAFLVQNDLYGDPMLRAIDSKEAFEAYVKTAKRLLA
jgi:hypothetical protein